jgi:tRNA pseudouridine55 synthase
VPELTAGIVLVDKPQGMTSHDVVSRVRRALGTRKVGHAGTLDPMATGLLVLGANTATRLLTWLVGLDKEYFATIRLGSSTPTDDADSEPDVFAPEGAVAAITEAALAARVAEQTGDILQVPSAVSAIKVDGKRSYARVRAGETVELPPRPVTVSVFEILASRAVSVDAREYLDIDVRVECTSGTYIRALARDIGTDLGVGGHLTALRRTRVGPFAIAQAVALDDVSTASLTAPAEVASQLFPTITLDVEQTRDIIHGKRLPGSVLLSSDGPVAAVTPGGELLALLTRSGSAAKSLVVFPQGPA